MIVHVKNVVINVVCSAYWLPHRLRIVLMNRAGVAVGEGTLVKPRCYFGSPGPITIGARSYISYRCDFDGTGPVAIGDGVYIAAGASVGTCTHDIGGPEKRAGHQHADGVRVGDGSWVGMNSTILPGVTIGSGCVVAAGSVVTHDTEPNCLYAGVPAKRVRELDDPQRPVVVPSAA